MNNIYLWEAMLALGFCAVCAGAAMYIGKYLLRNFNGIQTIHSQIEGIRMKAFHNQQGTEEGLRSVQEKLAELEQALSALSSKKKPLPKPKKKSVPKASAKGKQEK